MKNPPLPPKKKLPTLVLNSQSLKFAELLGYSSNFLMKHSICVRGQIDSQKRTVMMSHLKYSIILFLTKYWNLFSTCHFLFFKTSVLSNISSTLLKQKKHGFFVLSASANFFPGWTFVSGTKMWTFSLRTPPGFPDAKTQQDLNTFNKSFFPF